MSHCRICNHPISAFMSFGKMPIANAFLERDQFSKEYFFELMPAVCEQCSMFQIIEQPTPSVMFHDQYAFFSQTSKGMMDHFEQMAQDIIATYCQNSDPFVVELGSNDGILLRHFQKAKIRHLGVEPSANVAEVAKEAGIQTMVDFFSADVAKQIKSYQGKADVVMSANVMCHIPDLNNVAKGIADLLKPTGVLVFEDPYLGDVLRKTSYDQIYDEHVFLFSATSVQYAFGQHGLELIDVLPQAVHGGELRYILAHKGKYTPHKRVEMLLNEEKEMELSDQVTYTQFKQNCEKSKASLLKILHDLQDMQKVVVGYAATSKSTTVINYCGITEDLIENICDTTPIKQGKFSPGKHIPIVPHEAFTKDYPDYALLFAWNHQREILEKEQAYKAKGGRWILFVPEVKVL